MRSLVAALALAVLAPVAAAASLPLAAPPSPLPALPALPVPAVEVAPAAAPARAVVDLPRERLDVEATLAPLPVLEPVRVNVEKTRSPAGGEVLAAPQGALADRRAELAFAPPGRAPRADGPAAPPADAPTPGAGEAYQPRGEVQPPTPPATEVAFAAAAPAHGWPRAATLAASALLLLLAPLALYHRLRGARTLEQSTRARLHALLRERAGVTPTDAARALGIDPKTAHYHLVRLAKEGLAIPEGARRQVRYFAPGTAAPQERPVLVAAAASRDVLEAVMRAPGLTKSELAEAMGVARPTVNWHLRRLLRAGLVRCERDGRGVRVLPLISTLPKALNSQAL